MGKDKKNKGGTGSEYFDYAFGTGEAKSMMKRYGIEGASMGNPRMGGTQRSVDDVKKDIADAMMNDYDTRRSMEAAAMAGNKDAKKYAKKGFKAGNIQDAYGVLRDLKKEYVGGGGMDGAKNRAGLTHALVKADRENFIADNDAKYATKDELNALEQQEAAQAAFDDAEVELSPEVQAAKDRASSWSDSGLGGNVYGNSKPSASEASSGYLGSGDDEQDSSAVTPTDTAGYEAGQSYLSDFKDKLRANGKFVPTL